MHIHGNSIATSAAGLYSAAQGARAAAAQRAAEVRKKLIKGSSETDSVPDSGETFMIGQWMDARHSQVLSGDQYRATASGKDPDFG